LNPKQVVKEITTRLASDGLTAALSFIESSLVDYKDNQKVLKSLYRQQSDLFIKARQWRQACSAYNNYISYLSKAERSNISESRLFNDSASLGISGKFYDSALKHVELIGFNPNHVDGLRNFSIILRNLKDFEDALYFATQHNELNPDSPHGLNTLGTIYADIQQNDRAIECYLQSLELDPDSYSVHSNLANEYHIKANIDLAYYHSTKALSLKSDDRTTLRNHLTQLRRVCAFDELERIDWWELFSSDNHHSISNSFLQLLVLADSPQACYQFKAVTAHWGKIISNNYAISAKAEANKIPSLTPSHPIRIGFVSGDFRDHSVARFIWPLFEYLSRNSFQLKCFSFSYEDDHWRKQFEQKADVFIDCDSMSPSQFKTCLSDEPVDILFDLTGFTKGSRTEYFAQRLAPLQVSWLGFPGTIGVPSLDYIFVDKYLKPDAQTIHEKCLVTEGTTVCFSSLPDIPITSLLPVEKRGYITFGTLNNSYKITRAQLAVWAEVMNLSPDSHFLFVRREFESYFLRQNILREFNRHGIASSRIHFYNNRRVSRHYLDCYNEIDLCLDTFPVTGGTTTTDALWMGVPVVAREGFAVHQRVCSSILRHLGRDQWIAQSNQEFVRIAARIASDVSYLKNQRLRLRDHLKSSVLCNSQQFASDFANAIYSII